MEIVKELAWRLGRRLYCAARGDMANDPTRNGEYWLVDRCLEAAGGEAVALDIGANVGDWTAHVLQAARHRTTRASVFVFEPASATFAHVSKRYRDAPSVHVVRAALAAESGTANFFVIGDLAGTNSLGEIAGASMEQVDVCTVDQIVDQQGLRKVNLVKSDTEGFDSSVLAGAVKSLAGGVIDAWQFEYNHRWIQNRAYLFDVFQLVANLPYRVGRLRPERIELFDRWHPEMERFFEANYVLIHHSSRLLAHCVEGEFSISSVYQAR
jgi:FkbM family methyltransferase